MTLSEAIRYLERVLAVWCAFCENHSKFETAIRTVVAATKIVENRDK